jgi:3-phosphoshikimate 1-carboxyvinyltransferase
VAPLERPPDVELTVPGSKSLTNRALVLAALATGTSHLRGALDADDTEALRGALVALGVSVERDGTSGDLRVVGLGGPPGPGPADLDARLSGTTARFLLPVLALGPGPYRLDGGAPLRRRPMGPAVAAVRDLGARVDEPGEPGHLPLVVRGGALRGGEVTVPADLSSQFVSGLLLAAPLVRGGLVVRTTGTHVSRPYLDLTVDAVRAFGGHVTELDDGFRVAAGGYRGREHRIEPDASAASYLFAAAALTGGRVRVLGLDRTSRQGDLAVVDVLARMGATVVDGVGWTEVVGTGALRGVDVDLSDLPDMAPTVAVVAARAEGPTRVRGVGIIRHHETDRIAAVVAELRRLGVGAEAHDDGVTVRPAPVRPGRVRTYDDHRMAMSFALLGLVAPGIEIDDPGCVAKTFPDFFEVLERLR